MNQIASVIWLGTHRHARPGQILQRLYSSRQQYDALINRYILEACGPMDDDEHNDWTLNFQGAFPLSTIM